MNCLGVNGGGGRTYLENFLPALEQAGPDLECSVIVRPFSVPELPEVGPRIRYVPAPLASGVFSRFLAEQTWLPAWLAREKMEVLYSPADTTSFLAPCPVVLAMRNMNLYVKRDKGWAYSFKLKFSALSALARFSSKIARKIIFVSHSSKDAISRQLGIGGAKQEVIYHGVSPVFAKPCSRIPDELSWIRSKTPYLLSVSSVYRYKNYVRLIEAFARYLETTPSGYHLIIAGKPFDKPYFEEMQHTVRKTGKSARIHLAGEIPYAHLPALYQNAALFVFPSYLETFGHPLVEAMASGVPIVAADIENSREITGGAARFFDPYRVADLARVIVEVLEKEDLQEDLKRRGKARASHFSWTRCAEETVAVFRKARESQDLARVRG